MLPEHYCVHISFFCEVFHVYRFGVLVVNFLLAHWFTTVHCFKLLLTDHIQFERVKLFMSGSYALQLEF